MPRKSFEKYLTKIDRIAAWILLIAFILYMISGYGLTKGLISSSFARSLHIQLLPLIIIITFVLHVGLSIRMALIRWQIWGKISKAILVLACLAFLGFFIYVELFYQAKPRVDENVLPAGEPGIIEETIDSLEDQELDSGLTGELEEVNDQEDVADLKVFTLKELSYYDGKEGRPAYVAVDGIVYDNTEIFRDGQHYSHLAGQELAEDFYSYHILEEILKYPVVGRLAEES